MINKSTYLIVFIVTLWGSTLAQSKKGIDNLSLNGTWEIIFDDANQGVEGAWHLDKNFDANADKKSIEVPNCWETVEKNYEGVAYYRKKFSMPEKWKGKILELKFDASNYLTQVWLNEQVVGFHEGGYTPFSFRIDKLAKPGEENTLTVRVISPIILTNKRIDGLGRQEVPMWRGAINGGIWQPVTIIASGVNRISDVFIQPNIHDKKCTFGLEIENTETEIHEVTLHVNVSDLSGKKVAEQAKKVYLQPGKNHFDYALKIPNAHYWSMDHPYLYRAAVEITAHDQMMDRWSAKFGMREFTVRDGKFVLNDTALYLKACFFEGLYPVKLAYPDSRAMAVKEVTLAKEAGFNMIRPWRKPAPQMWLDICDSLGVLTVGSLVTECMNRPISTPRLPFVVENELRETILANRNRTCIVQWELFNEINRPILAQMLNSMSILARDLDPTRMILDESGGWGEGANLYLPYQRLPLKFNDIHHYSGSQINEEEYDGYLAIAKTKGEIAKLGLGDVKGYGKNVVTGVTSYVSELGYGSTPDLTLDNKLFKEKGNPIVSPTIYHKKLAKGFESAIKQAGFEEIYPSMEDFFLEQQKMHGIANKRIIEAVRSNSGIAGYCVHALVAGDWVLGAGLLDLWRNPKTLVYDMTREANQKQIVPIRILPRNVYADRGARLEIKGVNELKTEPSVFSVKIKSKAGETVFQKKIDKEFKNGISTLFSEKLKTKNMKGTYTVHVEVFNDAGALITSNSQSFDVFATEQLTVPNVKIAVVDRDNTLTPFLQKKHIDVVPFASDLDKRIPVFVGKANKKDTVYMKLAASAKKFAEDGGYVVFLDVPGEKVPGFNRKLKEVETDMLPFGAQMLSAWMTLGGWAAKSHLTTDHPIFSGLPTGEIMHGVYENVHPKTAMAKQEGKYIAGLIGYDHFPDQDIMLRHYNGPGEVWRAADILEVKIGKGKMLLSTMDILRHLDTDPVADKIMLNMIDFAGKQNPK